MPEGKRQRQWLLIKFNSFIVLLCYHMLLGFHLATILEEKESKRQRTKIFFLSQKLQANETTKERKHIPEFVLKKWPTIRGEENISKNLGSHLETKIFPSSTFDLACIFNFPFAARCGSSKWTRISFELNPEQNFAEKLIVIELKWSDCQPLNYETFFTSKIFWVFSFYEIVQISGFKNQFLGNF